MKLLDQVRNQCRLRHYSIRTEEAYSHWIERYIRFHDIKHPNTMGAAEIEEFLTHLAVERHVAASTTLRTQSFFARCLSNHSNIFGRCSWTINAL